MNKKIIIAGSRNFTDYKYLEKILDEYIKNEPYVLEGVWEKIDIDIINVVIANGIK